MIEYLASFWNPEAVKNIQETRKSTEKHNFKTDKEFEQEVISGKYKESKLIESIKKLKEMEENSKKKTIISNKHFQKSKLPTDLSSIQSTIEKFNGRRK